MAPPRPGARAAALLIARGAAAASIDVGAAGGRETVNFDFAWRTRTDEAPPAPTPPPPAPPAPPGACEPLSLIKQTSKSACTKGTSFGCVTGLQEMYVDNGCSGSFSCNGHTITCTSSNWLRSNCSCAAGALDAVGGPPGPPAGTPPESLPKYDDSTWEVVDAPHDMLINQEFNAGNSKSMAYLPRNSGWYRKHFMLPSEYSGKSVWIYIEGSFHATTSYLNGVQIGFHGTGYTSFWLRLDNVTGVQYGAQENVLALRVDASFGTGWWYEGGGLIRHQYLVATNPTHLEPDGTWSYAKDITGVHEVSHGKFVASSATIVTSAEVANHGTAPATVTVRATIATADGAAVGTATSGAVTVAPGATAVANSSKTIADAACWSVQSPALYTVTVEVLSGATVLDTYEYSVGVRTITYDTKGLHLNGKAVKVRGFCDHSNFAGVGGAVPDRVNLYRVQMLRSVGGNAWRMAHNPPIPARLDFMDQLGMLALDENRNFAKTGDGGSLPAQLTDMRDLIKRDRSHPSVMAWSFCNEGECNADPSVASSFRNVSYEFDGTRSVTQNHYIDSSTPFLDIQGFSHKGGSSFDSFHSKYPTKPIMATECCSCMSQRGIDQDACPKPKDGGCQGYADAGLKPGTFYNNNIGKCTADQVINSDSREFVAGTFIWSGFDYYGEARGFPQNTKCRGTVSDLAGFHKETAYWIRSWWLSNISGDDYGKPKLAWPGQPDPAAPTVFIIESWQPAPDVYNMTDRTINVYTNAPGVKLELNGKSITDVQPVPFFGQATFNVKYEPGNLTAIAVDAQGSPIGAYSALTQKGAAASIVLSLDAPSERTGTGSHVVADGEDVAMVRATLLDAAGNFAYGGSVNISFAVASGPGRIWTTHNGDPADDSPRDVAWVPSYHGLARAFVRTTHDGASPLWHRRRLREVDVDGGRGGSVRVDVGDGAAAADIVLRAEAPGLAAAELTIPVSTRADQLPRSVAAAFV